MKPPKDFLSFQKHFTYWQERFGLMGYKVYFKYAPLDDEFANITIGNGNTATVCLNSKLPDKDKPFKDIKRSAKHEAIHLLLYEVESLALSRYLREGEVIRAEEALTFKLEKLIV